MSHATPSMIGRLGNVLYWLGCGVAALLLLFALFGLIAGSGSERYASIVVFAVIGVLVWLAGRACRYVLAGR